MGIPHPFPYQGSKRVTAKYILPFLPKDVDRLIEPFAGSAAMSLAALYYEKVDRVVLNDKNTALMMLWNEIINNPEELSSRYEYLWNDQLGREKEYYNQIRCLFNEINEPHYLLYLLARCVKAAVRYNSRGEFNQAPDNRRKGTRPATMSKNIKAASEILTGRVAISSTDYRNILQEVTPMDVVYMDPPYQGVSSGEPRYINGIQYDEFVDELGRLNNRGISYIVSYDGQTGSKRHGNILPEHLRLRRIEIDEGKSSQEILLGRENNTIESLYLSPVLINRLR